MRDFEPSLRTLSGIGDSEPEPEPVRCAFFLAAFFLAAFASALLLLEGGLLPLGLPSIWSTTSPLRLASGSDCGTASSAGSGGDERPSTLRARLGERGSADPLLPSPPLSLLLSPLSRGTMIFSRPELRRGGWYSEDS